MIAEVEHQGRRKRQISGRHYPNRCPPERDDADGGVPGGGGDPVEGEGDAAASARCAAQVGGAGCVASSSVVQARRAGSGRLSRRDLRGLESGWSNRYHPLHRWRAFQSSRPECHGAGGGTEQPFTEEVG
jgi:hypothetical protein